METADIQHSPAHPDQPALCLAGAYAFGRTESRVSIEDGHKKIVRGFTVERKDWEVLIQDANDQVTAANLIVSTTNNNEAMNRSVTKVAMDDLSGHEFTEGAAAPYYAI